MSKIRSLDYVRSLKELTDVFDVIDRKGQGTLFDVAIIDFFNIGTFASVFTVQSKSVPSSDILAMKMIVPTVELRRVENELRALKQLEYLEALLY